MAFFSLSAKAAPAPGLPSMQLLVGGVFPLPAGDTYTYAPLIPQGTQQTFSFTIANIGSANLVLTQVSSVYIGLSGTAANEVVLDETNIIASSTVAPAGGVTFTVTSKPTTGPGVYSLSLSIANNDPTQNPFTGTVNYTISAPIMSLSVEGSTLANGDTYTHTTPIAQGATETFTFTIENVGNANLVLTQVSSLYVGLSGTAANEVVADETTITSPISPSGSVTFAITTKATTAPGPYTLMISIANNDLTKNPYTGTINYTVASATPTINATEAALSLYPNPSADGQFFIKGDVDVEKIIVYGATGTKEELAGLTTFYTKQKGVLIVHVYTNKGIITDKIIVQ